MALQHGCVHATTVLNCARVHVLVQLLVLELQRLHTSAADALCCLMDELNCVAAAAADGRAVANSS